MEHDAAAPLSKVTDFRHGYTSLTEEVYQWLEANVGPNGEKWRFYRATGGAMREEDRLAIVLFADEAKAALFRLFWA